MSASVKVSICIPTYNNVSEVERLLKSIYEQEYQDFEVNISDDSTNDEIAGLVMEYPQVNYIHNAVPYGHIFNWNAAIRMAKGEYIKIMFSDDWFTDNHSLGAFVALLDDNPKAMMAFSGSRQVMLDGQDIGQLHHVTSGNGMKAYDRHASQEFIDNLEKDYRFLFLGNQIGAPSATIYRRGSSPTLFDEQSNWASDMFLYFDLLSTNGQFAYTTKPLVSIGVHVNQYTESFSEKDMRIYNDYRYMYTKYHLNESWECRTYFMEKFIVKYNQGYREAKALGIETGLFLKTYLAEFRESIRCFVGSRLSKR